jgi:putative superfamily III holin-X
MQGKPLRVDRERSSLELAREIGADLGTLVRKELELARQEMLEAIAARMKAAGAGAVAGVMGFVALLFFGLAAVAGVATELPFWASCLVVAGGFAVLALVALGFALLRVKRSSMAPEATVRTVKEDIQWAKAQLRR